MESRIQIPLTKTGIPVPGIRNRWHGIKNPRLFWIPLHGFTHCFCTVVRMVGGGQRFIVESSNWKRTKNGRSEHQLLNMSFTINSLDKKIVFVYRVIKKYRMFISHYCFRIFIQTRLENASMWWPPLAHKTANR